MNCKQNTVIFVKHLQKNFKKRHHHSIKEIITSYFSHKYHKVKYFSVLNKITFRILKGESVAILGLNGSGKSTLLKIISGVMQLDKGHLYTKGTIAGLIEIGAGFVPELSGRENIYLNGAILGMSKNIINKKFSQIVHFSGVKDFIDTEVKFFSSGMYLRLAFSVAIHSDPDLFLIDEILAVGDERFQKKCIDKIKKLSYAQKTLLIVSHDLNLVSILCKRGIVLHEGNIIFDGKIQNAINKLRKL